MPCASTTQNILPCAFAWLIAYVNIIHYFYVSCKRKDGAVISLCISLYIDFPLVSILAFMSKPGAGEIFNAAIFCTVFFPVLIYIYMWTAKWLKGRGTDKKEDTDKKDSLK